jgi:hypothetical protein
MSVFMNVGNAQKDHSEFIVKVLLCHPSELVEQTPELKKAKQAIKKRYQELKRELPFTESEIQAKTEWLESYLQKIS